MTPYPHPAVNLAIFQARLSKDIDVDNTSYQITCDAPVPTSSGLYNQACAEQAAIYNSMVDMEATGALTGEVDQYLYDRLDFAKLALPARTFGAYLKGAHLTVVDLLPEFNRRSGLNVQPQDILAYALPACECACGPVGVRLEAAPSSLLFIGWIPLYVYGADVPLPDVVLNVFLPPLQLPPPTP